MKTRSTLLLGAALVASLAALPLFTWAGEKNAPASSPTPAQISTTVNQEKATTKDMNKEEAKKKLTPEQYRVTCEAGTEPAFHNAYWNNHAAGIYVDVISGKPLFASTDKFDSGTGWPSFTKPINKAEIVEKVDKQFFMTRTEVRSKDSDAHLGHLFDDGPAPTGMRYCVNSASLRFIPLEKMEAEGYGKYLYLFQKEAKNEPEKSEAATK